MASDDFDEKRALLQATRLQKIGRVRQLAPELGTRGTARRMGLSRNTVTLYRRLAGLTPPKPLRHMGGGRWQSAANEDEED